tara:strand:- start:4 stop:405 length:402 start_codon:yes stop_codon:yes gene_type:complete
MDYLGMMVRRDREEALIKKKREEWLEEERNRSWSDFEIETDSESEEEESDYESEDEEDTTNNETKEETPKEETPKEEVYEMPPITIESKVEWRIDVYTNELRNMTDLQIQNLCVREGILNENEVFDTIGVRHD